MATSGQSTEPHDNESFATIVFNQNASSYERMTGFITFPVAERMVELTINKSLLKPPVHILDNAAGPGIVSRFIVEKLKQQNNGSLPEGLKIDAADAATEMMELYKGYFTDAGIGEDIVKGQVFDGVDLNGYADNTFDISYTNMGIFFFSSPEKGAEEIFRTLKPGGTAVVSCWKTTTHFDVYNLMQKKLFPNEPPFSLPFLEPWKDHNHAVKVLQNAGLQDITYEKCDSWYEGAKAEEVVDNLVHSFLKFGQVNLAEVKDEAKKVLLEAIKEELAKEGGLVIKRPGGEDRVGIPMQAWIVVAKKPVV